MTDYADDHQPANPKPPPLLLATPFIPATDPPRPPTHDEIVTLCIKAIRANPKREPAARAHRLMNYALTLERLAESDEEWAAMRLAAEKLRQIAEEIVAE